MGLHFTTSRYIWICSPIFVFVKEGHKGFQYTSFHQTKVDYYDSLHNIIQVVALLGGMKIAKYILSQSNRVYSHGNKFEGVMRSLKSRNRQKEKKQ
jgi:hypothetical protein